MDYDKYDYLTYKKNKTQAPSAPIRKERSHGALSAMFKIFLATFIVIFCIIVVTVTKLSSRVDIEYSKGNLNLSDTDSAMNYTTDTDDDHMTIDPRLKLIQQEENAPSEAKILKKEKDEHEVIAQEHVIENKKIEKLEKIQEKNIISQRNQKEAQKEKTKENKKEDPNTLKILNKVDKSQFKGSENNIITSKVLIGRFSAFEDAKAFQNTLKEKDPTLAPYVRKVGDVYSVQIGSYQDFAIAKLQAQKLKEKGYDTWIFQQ